jgi:MarR family transcriptional regulator, organic hydroperoxide resistance regulator
MSDLDHSDDNEVLPDSVTCRIHRLSRIQHALLASGMEEIGLYVGQENALTTLWEHGPQTQASLAARVGVDTSTICRTLQRLERNGYVSRTPSPTDRRTTIVTATARAELLRERLTGVYQRTEDSFTAGLSSAERRQLASLLQKVLDTVGTESCPVNEVPTGPPAGSR